MDMSCPSCYGSLTEKAAKRAVKINFWTTKSSYRCPSCGTYLVKTEAWLPLPWQYFLVFIFLVIGSNISWGYKQLGLTSTAYWAATITTNLLYWALIYWLYQNRINSSPESYWKIKEPAAEQ